MYIAKNRFGIGEKKMKDCNFCNERVHEIFALEHAFSLSFAKPGCKNGFLSLSLSLTLLRSRKNSIFFIEKINILHWGKIHLLKR